MVTLIILTLFYFILILSLKLFPNYFNHINTFYILMIINMALFLTLHFVWHFELLPWILIPHLLTIILIISKTMKQRIKVIKQIITYSLSVTALTVGSYIVGNFMPYPIILPFRLLTFLALVWLANWVIYLLMTQLTRVPPKLTKPTTLLILGAGIFTEEVTPMLRQRLDAALYLSKQSAHPIHFVVSGGQGPDEPIPEALAMQRYLLKQGISPEQISMEDQSTNTALNMHYSKSYLPSTYHTVIVSSDFHVLRSLRLAQRAQIKSIGYGSLSPFSFRARALIRDYCGILFQYPITWILYSICIILRYI